MFVCYFISSFIREGGADEMHGPLMLDFSFLFIQRLALTIYSQIYDS